MAAFTVALAYTLPVLPAGASRPMQVAPDLQAALVAQWRRPIVRDGADRRIIDSLGTPVLVPAQRSGLQGHAAATPASVIVGTAEGYVLAIDQATATVRWRYRHGSAIDGVVSLITRADLGVQADLPADLALVAGRDQILVALDAASGQRVWRTPLEAASRAQITAAKGRLYVTTEANQAVAIEASSGRMVWSQGRAASRGLALLGHGRAAVAAGRVFAAFADGFVMAMDADDGHVLWEKPLSLRGGRFVDADADPIVVGERLFVASVTDGVFGLDVHTGQTLWHRPAPEVLSLCVVADGGTAQDPDPALLVAGDVFGRVQGLRLSDGSPRWRLDAGAGPATALTPYLHGVAFLAGSRGLVWADARTGRPHSVQPLGGMPGGGLARHGATLAHVGRGGALFLWQGRAEPG